MRWLFILTVAASYITTTTTAMMLKVSDFAAKPFIQRAISNPMATESVLSFFYGVDFQDEDHVQQMRKGAPMYQMPEIWYFGGDDYDKLCHSFIPAIRANAAAHKSKRETESVNEKVSKMLLFDQLARNAFRGTDEAFSYDSLAVELSLELLQSQLPVKLPSSTTTLKDVKGELYPPFILFCILPLMHSESAASHHFGDSVLDHCIQDRFADNTDLSKQFGQTKQFLAAHTQVIDRFGRYPHRNPKLDRECTDEELAWLADEENLPGWAKSQE